MNTAVVTLILGIAVPVLTVGITYLSAKVVGRDDRLRIKVDLALYESIPEEFDNRDALKQSIERRMLDHASPYTGFARPQQAALSIALGFAFTSAALGLTLLGPDQTGVRHIAGVMMYGTGCAVLLVVCAATLISRARSKDARTQISQAGQLDRTGVSAT